MSDSELAARLERVAPLDDTYDFVAVHEAAERLRRVESVKNWAASG